MYFFIRLFVFILIIFCVSLTNAQESRRKTLATVGQSRTLPGDTIAIKILLAELRQCVQQQKPLTLRRILADTVNDAGKRRSKRQMENLFTGYFTSARARSITMATPNSLKSTCDFDIKNSDIRIIQDRAYVNCQFMFHNTGTKTNETLTVIKHEDSAWKLAGARELMKFLTASLPRQPHHSQTRGDK